MPDDSDKTALTIYDLRPGYKGDVGPQPEGQKRLPARYTEALHAAIVEKVIGGNNKVTAATALGLPAPVYYAWQSDVKDGTAHPSIVQMFEDLERAYAMAEVKAVDKITDKDGSVENSKWFLERSRARDWSKQEQLIVKNELTAAFERLELEFGQEPQLLERIFKALTEAK